MPLNAEEEFQMQWIMNHRMEDKDEQMRVDAENAAAIAGLKVLRVIHGGGNPSYGNVKRIIDRKVRSEWSNRIRLYKVEPDNAGSSIMIIGKPANSDAPARPTPKKPAKSSRKR